MMKMKIGIIGGGNMGAAIIGGMRHHYNVAVCEQDTKRRRWLKRAYKVTAGDLKSVIGKSCAVILAVKPQSFDEILKSIRPLLARNQLVISIAAGITCRYIEGQLGAMTRVIRTMPNLPVQVSEGITGICLGRAAKSGDLVLVRRIFGFFGKTVVVEEKLMDAITAVSGSGPAYVFLFIECLLKAAGSLGLDKKMSRMLVVQTINGAMNLFESQDNEAAVLRGRVTSKGGTTQAAMDVFKKHEIESVFRKALCAARNRARELSK